MIINYAEMHKKQYPIRITYARRAIKEIYEQSKKSTETFAWNEIYEDIADKFFLSEKWVKNRHYHLMEQENLE